MENQNILRIVLSLAILAAFFLPLYTETMYNDTAFSAWALLTSGFKNIRGAANQPTSTLVMTVCMIIVIVCVVYLLISSVLRKPTSVLFNLIPFLTIIAFIIFNMTQAQENVGQTLQAFGTGFYIMFLGSFLLPFTSIAVPANS
jgi:drug/metabolite transporter superfamily protein YnfA